MKLKISSLGSRTTESSASWFSTTTICSWEHCGDYRDCGQCGDRGDCRGSGDYRDRGDCTASGDCGHCEDYVCSGDRRACQTEYINFITPPKRIKLSLVEENIANRQTIADLNQMNKLHHLVCINYFLFVNYVI